MANGGAEKEAGERSSGKAPHKPAGQTRHLFGGWPPVSKENKGKQRKTKESKGKQLKTKENQFETNQGPAT